MTTVNPKISHSIIPPNQVYKVYILDSTGNPSRIIVYQGNKISTERSIFSEKEQIQINTFNPEIIYATGILHKDDTIQTIKQKILLELDQNTIAYDELYLFSKRVEQLNLLKTYQMITDNDNTLFTKPQLGQFLMNIQCKNKDIIHYFNEINEESISYKDFIHGFPEKDEFYEISFPIGQKFASYEDMLYSANPFNILPTQTDIFKLNQQNTLLTFENHLLLNYGDIMDNVLYVSFAENTLKYIENIKADQSFIIALYYPGLSNKQIHNMIELGNSKTQLLSDSRKMFNSNLTNSFERIDKFYKIYYQRKNDLPYIERGIKMFGITLHPNNKLALPLDTIFKLIHCTEQIPYIKYMAGGRREPIYRLFANKRTKRGKKIPILSRIQISTYSKQSGKTKQITFAITYKNNNIIFVDFVHNGNILVNCTLNQVINIKEIEQILLELVNPIIETINIIIEPAGHSLGIFKNITDNKIEFNNIRYVGSINIHTKIKPTVLTSLLSSIFNIVQDDVTMGAILKFKRVENYVEMDAINTQITQVYKQTNNSGAVINSLVINFQMSEEEANDKFTKYLNDHILINGQYINKSVDIAANPGFPCIMNITGIDNKLYFEINEITSIYYIEIINIYIDSFLRITQYNKSVDYNIDTITEPKKVIDTEIKQSNNVILPDVTDIKPIHIIPIKVNMNEDRDSDDGILFSDDDEDGILFSDDDEDGILFSDDDENDDDEENDDDGILFSDDEENDDPIVGGNKIKKSFSERLKVLEPTLFNTHKDGLYKSYARLCPNQSSRQPVILTDDEKKRIDEEYPGSYEIAMKYGTNSKNKNWYVCPRYWCIKTNRPMTKEQVEQGDCGDEPGTGKVIPQTGKIPDGHYIYEFTDNIQHKDIDGKYRQHRPGFLPANSHPDYCLPCCFKQMNTEQQINRRAQCGIQTTDLDSYNKKELKKITNKPNKDEDEDEDEEEEDEEEDEDTQNAKNDSIIAAEESKKKNRRTPANIFSIDKYPIQKDRWGFLPLSIELFLHTDNSTSISNNNPALIKQNEHPLLRYGVEQRQHQSFIGIIADIYAYEKKMPSISIRDMRTIIAENISIDDFIKYHNGVLATTFQPKTKTYLSEVDIEYYRDTKIYKSITDFENIAQRRFIYDTIASYENFIKYLKDDDSFIDHVYLWDIISASDSTLFKNGLNIAIMEIMDNDITDNVELICPTNSYSNKLYDSNKGTILIIKHGDFYEPIYIYDKQKNGIIKVFYKKNSPGKLVSVFNMIMKTTNKYCKPLPSIPKKYKYKQNNMANTIYNILRNYRYKIDTQVLNYNGKVIGFNVFEFPDDNKTIFIPTFPSSIINNIKRIFMDDVVWLNYQETRDKLLRIHIKTKGEILCKPILKTIEDGLIVGIITETNQYISLIDFTENNIDDGIGQYNVSSYKENGYINADKSLTTSNKTDNLRTNVIRNISFETQFYIAFRNKLRNALNDYYNKDIRDEIERIISSKSYLYQIKLNKIEQLIKKITKDHISFDDFDKNVLDAIDNITLLDSGITKNVCLTKKDTLCIPSTNLVSGFNNYKLYYSRAADELLRYTRIRLFMLDNKQYLNVSNANYNVNDTEIILLHSLLVDYFDDSIPFETNKYIQNVSYNMANPSIDSQSYSNDISLQQQYELSSNMVNNELFTKECVLNKSNIIHSDNELWDNMYPENAIEMVLDTTIMCNYYVIMYIVNEVLQKQMDIITIKNTLIEAYKPYLINNKNSIYDILIKQGKQILINAVKLHNITFENMIMNEGYTLTNLDLWILATHLKLPIILFEPNKFTDFGTELGKLDWLILNGNPEIDAFYWVRSISTESKYNIITPTFHLRDVLGFQELIDAPNYIKHTQTLNQYIPNHKLTIKIKRRIVKK
jgi:hypothetical protein